MPHHQSPPITVAGMNSVNSHLLLTAGFWCLVIGLVTFGEMFPGANLNKFGDNSSRKSGMDKAKLTLEIDSPNDDSVDLYFQVTTLFIGFSVQIDLDWCSHFLSLTERRVLWLRVVASRDKRWKRE